MRKRFAHIVGPGADKVAGLSEEEQAKLHEVAVGSAQAIMAQLAFLCMQATAMTETHAVNGVTSGAIHGFCKHAWKHRQAGMSRAEVEALLVSAIRHGLEQSELAELRGGEVAGNA